MAWNVDPLQKSNMTASRNLVSEDAQTPENLEPRSEDTGAAAQVRANASKFEEYLNRGGIMPQGDGKRAGAATETDVAQELEAASVYLPGGTAI
ncbi:hypothetical protein [Breoghania sp. JC706]|uniref:hypothetical protein n=1 Tax=Breoghania sp. JC706 TaxID=3117732 RepID=UPI00300AD97F